MDAFDNESLEFIKFNVLTRSYGNIPNVLIKLKCVDCLEEIEAEIIANEPRLNLVDLAREAQELRYYPKLNRVEKQGLYESFLSTLHRSEDILNALLRGNTLLYDCIIFSCKTLMTGVMRSELNSLTSLVKTVRDLGLYIASRREIFKNVGCDIPIFFARVCPLN